MHEPVAHRLELGPQHDEEPEGGQWVAREPLWPVALGSGWRAVRRRPGGPAAPRDLAAPLPVGRGQGDAAGEMCSLGTVRPGGDVVGQ